MGHSESTNKMCSLLFVTYENSIGQHYGIQNETIACKDNIKECYSVANMMSVVPKN